MKARVEITDEHQANVWPAVTDSVILMASIFIVLAVTSMIFFASSQSRAIALEGDQGHNDEPPLLSASYEFPTAQLFPLGESYLLDPVSARANVEFLLEALAASVPNMREQASRSFAEGFHLVIEVSGHTDDQPFPQQRPTLGLVDGNWSLSAERATTVVYIIEKVLADRPLLRQQLGMPSPGSPPRHGDTIIRVVGYGPQLPQIPQVDASAGGQPIDVVAYREKQRAMSRRVEMLLHAEPTYALTAPASD